MSITREDAWNLLNEHVHADNLIAHAVAVEAVMRYFAKQFGEDEELWGIIGLCHDIDYERFPEEHCIKAHDILTEAGWPADHIRAVQSHGWGLCCDIEPETKMEKTLYTIDELTGLIGASALVRPSKSILDIKVKSVKKKWKAKGFSAGVDRSVIERGAQMLDMELSEVIDWTIKGMQPVAEQIGLKGNL